MNRLPFRAAAAHSAANRAGTSLVEVLMSLLVMGVGVVAVATLFPASVLRSIQATQLTNAAILRFNAEAMLSARPELLTVVPTPGSGTTRAIVDPLGQFRMANEDANYRFFFGGTGDGFQRLCPSNITTQNQAEVLTTSEDSWLTVIDTPLDTAAAADHLTIPSSITVSEVSITAAGSPVPSSYLILIGEIGSRKAVYTRQVTQISGQDLYWSEDLDGNNALDNGEDFNRNGTLDLNALPAGFVVNRVRVETWEPRYNWLLTVRKDSAGVSNVDVVVFFRRSFSLKDETVYNGQQTNGPFTSKYTVTGFDAADPPAWKRGGYMFDLQNGRWHRIDSVNSSTGELALEGTPSSVGARVMFPRGVIEVYPIGNKLP